ncbi:hypothetical protein [Zoogloea sp. LCSB751]|uniref:hypothetical protein n=1 Tax=Zoogloea sp. LCSB751 TaxID=1965277 RepID=UPI0009A51FDB|nr:hypothetical protein [Zoogloea sp. LCSB751]
MEMMLPEATELVGQLQTAHRLSVGFYQRLLPLLTRIASELEMGFWYWEPCHTNLPSRSTTAPGNKWAWDLAPMFASRHVYRRVVGELAQAGDVALIFNVYLDDNFKPEKRKALGQKGQPDPLTLPIGKATVEMYLYRCDGENGDSFEKRWGTLEYPSGDNPGWEQAGPQTSARLLTRDLASFITDPDSIVTDIRNALLEDIPEAA